LPAVFVDVDDPAPEALARLRDICPAPSCITFTGGGYHAYWWLAEPLSDMGLERSILRGLQRTVRSDSLSPVQSLRLVGSRNTKPGRNNALCRIIEMSDICYGVDAFSLLFSCPIAKPPATPSPHRTSRPPSATSINPTILQAVSNCLIA